MLKMGVNLGPEVAFEDAIKEGELLSWKKFSERVVLDKITSSDILDFCIGNRIVNNAEVNIDNRQIIFAVRNSLGKLATSRISFSDIAEVAEKYKYQVILYK